MRTKSRLNAHVVTLSVEYHKFKQVPFFSSHIIGSLRLYIPAIFLNLFCINSTHPRKTQQLPSEMQYQLVVAAFFGLICSGLSAPAVTGSLVTSLNALTPQLQCNALGCGCFLDLITQDLQTNLQRWSCSCNDNPNNLKYALPPNLIPTPFSFNFSLSSRSLAYFYTEYDFYGFEYHGYGDYSTCYNLPDSYDRKSKSFRSQHPNETPPLICCVYTARDCNEVGHDFTTILGLHDSGESARLQGVYLNGISSYRCARWIDEKSNCHGTG
jgi:hypothetical protein